MYDKIHYKKKKRSEIYIKKKESVCNAGDPSLIPGSGWPPGEGIGCPFQYSWASLVGGNVGDLILIPGLGRSPGEGNGYPLQYPVQENSLGCIVYGVTKNQTWLSKFHFLSLQMASQVIVIKQRRVNTYTSESLSKNSRVRNAPKLIQWGHHHPDIKTGERYNRKKEKKITGQYHWWT